MGWKKSEGDVKGKHQALVSDDGYTVCRVEVGDVSLFELWGPRVKDVPVLLGRFGSLDDAKAGYAEVVGVAKAG